MANQITLTMKDLCCGSDTLLALAATAAAALAFLACPLFLFLDDGGIRDDDIRYFLSYSNKIFKCVHKMCIFFAKIVL